MKCHRQRVCLLLQVISFIANCLAENLILNINFKKPIAVTDHAFLSFTLDPTTLLHNNDFIKNIERSTNMARGLAPAYVRLGGPQSNFYNFERAYSHEIDTDPNDMHFGTEWTLIYQWAKNAGLDVIVCITPHYIDNELKTHSTDPRNIAELLSFSDRMGYNISWQLGYECQTRCDLSGEKLGRYVAKLREMLKSFPRYSNSLITGPDIVAYKTAQQQRYLQDYLHSADAALSAITWHPDLDSISLNNDSISMHYDNMIADKDEMYKIINHAAGKKPLWIVESKPDESEHQYLEALIWMRRLGNAAKLDIQVVMRQLSDLSRANPIYWVSLLYKTLVDREVLEMKFQSNNESHVHFYSQCTKPSALYSKGAITIFGINLTPRKVTANLKGLKIKILHKYILSPDFETGNKMFSEKVLLNNKPLNLINDKNLPDINPEIIINPHGLELELSSGDIGFWIIPDAKVKACIWSEEETTENGIVKKLSKRHENDIRQDNQEEKEEDINQSNVIEEDVKKNTSQSNSKNRKIYAKQDRKKQKNVENENQQKVWNSKLLAKIKRILQKRLQKNESSNLQRYFMIDLGEEQGNSSKEVEEQQNLYKKHFKKTEVDDKFESIRDTLKRYKCILLEKKTQIDTEDIQDLKPQIQNIDNAVALISKIDDAFLLHKVTSNESIMGEYKDNAKNKEESIIKINKKLKEYLIELENSAETKANIIKKIEKYFNKLYSLLEDNDSTESNKNSQIPIHKDLMGGKRFKRHLDRKLENSKNIRVLKKRSRIDDLKDQLIKQKIKQKNDDKKKLISSQNTDNSKKNFNNNKNKYNNLFERDPVKTFFKNDAFENAARHIDYQHLAQEHKRIKNDNIYRKYSKIGDMQKYQSLMQEPERTKRDISKKLVEIGLRKDSASRKRSRIDDLKNYVIERKTKQKDDIKREGLLVPFNPRTTNSEENNFYGFFRRDPVKGFPESDIFVTTGDSLEQNGKDYDYVEDDYDDNDSEKKNTQHSQKSMLDHTEDNTWVEEIKDDHCDYMPNEFFENIKFSNTRIKENSKNYDDLWEAEFPSEEHNNNKNNNNNEFTVTEVIQEQPPNEGKEKRTREMSMQQLVNYDDSETQEYNQDAKYKALQLASKYSSTSSDQLPKTSTSNINYQASNVGLTEAKLKMEPEPKISNSFYLPSQVPIVRYNYGNYQTSRMNHDEAKLKEENGFVTNIDSRDDVNAKTTQYSRPTSVYAEYPIHDEIFQNKRNKRSNWEELRKIFAEEMIKEDEKNARDCHCRVIRASDSLKKLFYRRVKRNSSLLTPRSTDTSLENKNVNADITQSKKNVQNSMTREEYEEIMAGEILPSTSVIEPDYEESSTTTESVITELNTLDDKPTDTMQMIDVTSTSGVDNISEQYNEKKSTTNLLSVDSAPELSLSNNNSVKKETFFRAQTSDIQSENKTETYDSPEIISKIPSENKDNREDFIVSVTNNAQETTYEKVRDLIDKKEKADSSIYPTITEDQKNEEGHNNDYKTGLKSIDSLKEITEKIAEQVTTETILSKRATSTAIDNSKSNESKRKSKLLQNIEDNQNSESKIGTQLGKDANTKELKTMWQNLPRTSLEGLARYEGHLTRRAEHIDKLKEKLYARREKLLHQYQNELTKIADDQKRNLKRREAWERLRESDDFHRLIDQRGFIKVLLDDDVTFEDDDESYLIPIEFVPKQYNNIIDQVYLLVKAKKVRYLEHNKYHQFLRNLIDEERAETSKSLERKYNQYYEYIPKIIDDKQEAKGSTFLNREHNQDSPKTIENERESTETTSKSFDRKVFIIDPSTYYGGEPILQLHEDYLKLPKYYSNIKSQIQEPTSRWLLGNFHRVLSRLKSSEDQQASKSKEYIKKLPIKDYYDQGNILYVLDTQRQNDLSKELAALAQVWLSSFDRRDVNQAVSNKEADAKVIKTKKSENVELTKHAEINKSYNSNDKTENNLNINNNKAVEHVEKINDNEPEAKEFEKENMRTRRDVGKRTDECIERLPHFLLTGTDVRNGLNRDMRVHLEKDSEEIFNKQPTALLLLTKKDKPLNAGLKSENHVVSSRRNFKINQENEKGYKSNYITLIPIKVKNIYEMLEATNNDDSLERFEIPARWNDQYILGKIPGSMNKYLDDETSEEFEYEDLSNLQSEDTENIPDEESCSSENKQDVSVEDSEAESEKEDEQYKITNDEIDQYLGLKNQIGSNERGIFLLLPWRNIKKRQRRQIKNEINEDVAQVKREVTRQLQPNKSILAEDLENKRTKRYYLNNDISPEDEENMIETNDIRGNYLLKQTNRKNRDDLLEDFIKAHKKDNLYNNEVSLVKNKESNESIPLNNISKSDKKLLQEEMLQDHTKSVVEFINDSEKNFNDSLASDEEKTSGTTGNAFHTAIMNIKDFFAFFSKISQIIMPKF